MTSRQHFVSCPSHREAAFGHTYGADLAFRLAAKFQMLTSSRRID